MANICVLISVIFILNIFAEGVEKNYEDEMDPVLDMLLNGEYDDVELKGSVENDDPEEQPVYSDGVWKCGNCSNMAELKLIYSENYDLDRNYDAYTEDINMEIQIGFSLKGMRCITMKAAEDGQMTRVTGACDGEQVTLGVINSVQCLISIYG